MPLLKDPMLKWYATDAIFPAAVHGYYGRKAARERRWAVGVVHRYAAETLTCLGAKKHLRGLRHASASQQLAQDLAHIDAKLDLPSPKRASVCF